MHSRRRRARSLSNPTITMNFSNPRPTSALTTAPSTSTITTTTTTTSSSSSKTSSTTPACAACKYQRRKCEPNCLLAPYFPYDRQHQFLNAHKLFGVSNITKVIKNLTPHEKDEAMRTIIYQSDARAHDPVLGCYRIIRDLHRQIEFCQAELEFVLRQLEICRAQAQAQAHQEAAMQQSIDPAAVGCDRGDLLGPGYGYVQPTGGHPGQEVEGYMGNGQEGHEQASLHDFGAWAMQDSTFPSDFQIKQGFEGGCDDMRPILDIADDRNDGINLESEIIDERSDHQVILEDHKAEMTEEEDDTGQQVLDHDLKGAATLFTLTNCTS
ncbi:LOB domain-containing protein 22-like [Rhodamnia argentea]|uniref:LOB domain-containing protein 22-like n=1 Tax=Rhodamnia argentea TaxID=178133 RepID=A0A8B8NVS7_9MYRT|nr:LOB domain-containing protein 22-like [Rhodamnia argentea]